MKILLLCGSLIPQPDNNANILMKLEPFFSKNHEVHLFSPAFGETELPDSYYGIKAHWVTDSCIDFKRKFLFPVLAKCADPKGYSDALRAFIMLRELKQLKKKYRFDIVISTMEPYSAGFVSLSFHNTIKILYLMDPPEKTYGAAGTRFRNRYLKKIIEKQDLVITTPFIRDALKEIGIRTPDSKIITVGFPVIQGYSCGNTHVVKRNNRKINLLFCGWMCSQIRSPQYFLDVVAQLDNRFCVYLIGKECEDLDKLYHLKTKAEIVTLPQQPYQVALDAMHDADILVNIGNSVPVHMPSKILEYINTGKPIINFYKLKKCPTLYYTNRYPLCLNVYEGDLLSKQLAEDIVTFCKKNKNKIVDREYILREFYDCTPEYIANEMEKMLTD